MFSYVNFTYSVINVSFFLFITPCKLVIHFMITNASTERLLSERDGEVLREYAKMMIKIKK